MQSMPITTNAMSTGQAYSIEHYVIKCVSDLRQVGGFLHKTDRHDIAETLLKVVIKTITPILVFH